MITYNSVPPEVIKRYEELVTLLRADPEDNVFQRSRLTELLSLEAQHPTLSQISPGCSGTTGDWNENEMNLLYANGSRWNNFLRQCPTDGGFHSETENIVRFMRTEHEKMVRHKSQYGERYLVEWALHHMPDPTRFFVRSTLEMEELKPERWTIEMFKDHLTAWVYLFEGAVTKQYAIDVLNGKTVGGTPDRELYEIQTVTGGGWVAHALFSSAEHQRWAIQMWRSQWHIYWEKWLHRITPCDWPMSGM